MKAYREYRGFWTFDLLISALVTIAIFYIAISSIGSLSAELAAQHGFTSSVRALAVSEQVVKRELAKVAGPLILANVIDDANLQEVVDDLHAYHRSPISVEVFTQTTTEAARAGRFGRERTCARRFVLYKGEIGYVDVCTS